jgi:hypothetical protein
VIISRRTATLTWHRIVNSNNDYNNIMCARISPKLGIYFMTDKKRDVAHYLHRLNTSNPQRRLSVCSHWMHDSLYCQNQHSAARTNLQYLPRSNTYMKCSDNKISTASFTMVVRRLHNVVPSCEHLHVTYTVMQSCAFAFFKDIWH